MTEPIQPIGSRNLLTAVTPVQRRRPRDDDDERKREREERDQPAHAAPRPDEPEHLIDIEA